MRFTLSNKVAVVTGGLGNLGMEFAKTLQEAGADVVILDLVSKHGYKIPKRMHYIKTDITNKQDLSAALAQITKTFSTPSILVNCAAIDVPPGLPNQSGLLESKESEIAYDRIMEVNVKGLILTSQTFGNAMAQQKEGSIINISSIYGEISPDQRIYTGMDKIFIKPISYCASKAAIPNITRYLATYYAKHNVRVNTLTLGGVLNRQDPSFVSAYSSKVPLGRMASKSEYNEAIIFLASDSSSYMTGSNLIIDGGYTAW